MWLQIQEAQRAVSAAWDVSIALGVMACVLVLMTYGGFRAMKAGGALIKEFYENYKEDRRLSREEEKAQAESEREIRREWERAATAELGRVTASVEALSATVKNALSELSELKRKIDS